MRLWKGLLKMKNYDLNLPVFRTGDDLQYWLNETNDDQKKAFLKMSQQYDEASKICKRVAGIIAEHEDVKIAKLDSYTILLTGNEASLGGLIVDGVLFGPGDEEGEEPPYNEEDELYPQDEEDDECFERGYD